MAQRRASGAPPTAFDLQGIHLYLDAGEPGVVRYVPGDPSPERDPQGHPTLTLVVSDRGAILQLGTWWTVAPDALAALAVALAAARPDLAGARLQPAPVRVTAATLKIAGPDGSLLPVKTSTTSGLPPWNAVFSATLDSAQKAQAVAAVHGRRDLVVVDYALALPPEAATGAATALRRTDVGDWFPEGDGDRHVLLTGASI